MPVTLQNRLRQMQVFNLVHEIWCRGRECSCSDITAVVADENPRTGERAQKRITRRAPGALTLLAGETRADLPDAVLLVPDVRAALGRGFLRVVAQTPTPPPAPPPAPKSLRTARSRKEE